MTRLSFNVGRWVVALAISALIWALSLPVGLFYGMTLADSTKVGGLLFVVMLPVVRFRVLRATIDRRTVGPRLEEKRWRSRNFARGLSWIIGLGALALLIELFVGR